MRRPIKAAAFLAGAALLGAAGPPLFEVALWFDGEAPRGPGIIETRAHPCGAVAIVRIATMPPHRAGAITGLGSELIAESGGEGARWSVPVDYRPLAIDGREILLETAGQRLWIATDGAIRREPRRRRYPPIATASCPAGGVHADSDYAICGRLADLGTRRSRLIQYEGPCT
jgi:hypothetical protein